MAPLYTIVRTKAVQTATHIAVAFHCGPVVVEWDEPCPPPIFLYHNTTTVMVVERPPTLGRRHGSGGFVGVSVMPDATWKENWDKRGAPEVRPPIGLRRYVLQCVCTYTEPYCLLDILLSATRSTLAVDHAHMHRPLSKIHEGHAIVVIT